LLIARQNELLAVDYHNLMSGSLDEVSEGRVKALGKIERDKLIVAKAYNKRVKEKMFQAGDLAWNKILPIGSRSSKFGKWSPNWEGPYRIEELIPRNSYMVQNIQGTSLQGQSMKSTSKSTILSSGKTLELENGDNAIITLSTKNGR
jgi:hypothetical protein